MMDGWKLVPAIPTDDMIVAFAEGWYSKRQCIDDPDMLDAYRDMLDAAPAPPNFIACHVDETCGQGDVPPAGGEVEVLGYVIESEYLASTTYSKGKDPRQEFKRDRRVTERESSRPQSTIVRDVNITELVDRTHVTRLTAERDALKAEVERHNKDNEAFIVECVTRGNAIASLQSELTKALEGMVEYFPEGHSDGECFSVERAKAVLAHQSAPAAKGGCDE